MELDAEIKHAFAELERKDNERKDMQATIDDLDRNLTETCKDLEATQDELIQKAEESKATLYAHQHALVSLYNFFQCANKSHIAHLYIGSSA